ncbi:unnamed protein product, partial [Phaeothamnion confervicola]
AHERVGDLLVPRPCLGFGGGEAYVDIGAADIEPPWTVEAWLWRPALAETAREKVRAALTYRLRYREAADALREAESRVALLKPQLQQANEAETERLKVARQAATRRAVLAAAKNGAEDNGNGGAGGAAGGKDDSLIGPASSVARDGTGDGAAAGAGAATAASGGAKKSQHTAMDRVTDALIAAATARDDAKVAMAVAAVRLEAAAAAALREVRQLWDLVLSGGAPELERLALCTTPWYAEEERQEEGEEEENGEGEAVATVDDYAAANAGGNGGAASNQQGSAGGFPVAEESTAAAAEKAAAGTAGKEEGAATGGRATSRGKAPKAKTSGRTTEASAEEGRIASGDESGSAATPKKPSLMNVVAAEAATAEKSATAAATAFWTEWESLTGAELAVRFDNMAAETVPRLLREVSECVGVTLGTGAVSGLAYRALSSGTSLLSPLAGTAGGADADSAAATSAATGDATGVEAPEASGTDPAGSSAAATTAAPAAVTETAAPAPVTPKHVSRKAARKALRQVERARAFGEPLEQRIRRAVARQGGFGTLLGSERSLLQLETGSGGGDGGGGGGEDDRLGFTVIGLSEIAFDYSLPRQRWVHLAVVAGAGATAGNGGGGDGCMVLDVFEDGRPVARAALTGALTPSLPQRDVGGRVDAAHCLLQELRVWRGQRSKRELRHGMRELLKPEAVGDGLAAYYTLEEGRGRLVRDATDQRYRARLHGARLQWLSSQAAAAGCEPPTPSWRERYICPVELRR